MAEHDTTSLLAERNVARAKTIDNLAIFGKPPLFNEKLHVGRPNLCDRDALFQRFNEILDRNWLTNAGPVVKEFERRIAALAGVKHCIAMCNATIALEIAIRALGMSGEVIVPSLSFVATAHALQWQQVTPVFCDVNPTTYTLDPAKVLNMITPRTTGIIGVHLWGRACQIDELQEIGKSHGLKILYDAAHAFGCTYKGIPIGRFGDAEVFSFHATKFLNTFEGGAVVTNNDELAAKVRLMKHFGFAGHDNVIFIGTNGKMTEFSAAMGLTSLESMEEFREKNYQNYLQYQKELESIPGLHVLPYDVCEKNNYQYVVFSMDETITSLRRDCLIEILHAENIIARRYFSPGCHRMEPYRSYFPHAGLLLPETERIVQGLVTLPTGTAIGLSDIKGICDIIRLALTHGREIEQRLSSLK
jgi:dTDP-4-amino-4,6-dideoxygalactose transaminase